MAAMPMPMPGGGGGPQNPMDAARARRIIEMLASRGQAGPGGAEPGKPNPTEAVGQELANIGGADPQAIVATLNQMRQMCVALIPATAFRLPGVSKHISKILDNAQAAINEAQKALQTTQSVEQLPIGNSMANLSGGAAGPGA